jgi:mannosyltransferase
LTTDAREARLWRHACCLALWLVVALGALLRFFLIGDKTIWLDEALTIWPAAQSLCDGCYWLVQVDAHPPVSYAPLRVWLRAFGDGAMAARSPSAACGTLALPPFFATARRSPIGARRCSPAWSR